MHGFPRRISIFVAVAAFAALAAPPRRPAGEFPYLLEGYDAIAPE